MTKKVLTFRNIIVALTGLTLLLLWVGCGGSDSVAKVNGQDITKSEVDQSVKFRFGCDTAGDPNSDQFKALEKQMVEIQVMQKIINSEAGKLGLSVSDDDVNSAIDQQKQAAGGDDKFNDKLSCSGVGDDQLRDMMKGDQLFQKLITQVTQDATQVTDAEAQDYFNQHQTDQTFVKPETRKVRHILVADEATANQVKAQLDAGADFAALAKQYSTDPGSKDKGGVLNASDGSDNVPSQNSGFAPEFEKAMDALAAGQTSGPVKTQFGYHIIRVEAITPAGPQTFDQIKDDLKRGLALEKQRAAFDKWLADARSRYDISYSAGYEPATTGAGQTAPAQP